MAQYSEFLPTELALGIDDSMLEILTARTPRF
jgi:hypothetical protein